MAALITYTGGTGLMDALGPLLAAITESDAQVDTLRTRRSTIAAAFTPANYSRIARTLGNIDAQIAAITARMKDYRYDAQQVLIEHVHAAIPLHPYKTVNAALIALIGDMRANGIYVTGNGPSVGSVTPLRADGSANTGTGTVVVSLVDEFGYPFDYIPACTITVECVQDSQAGDATAIETFYISANAALDGMDPDWPGGPGLGIASSSITASVAEQSNFLRNVLKNSTLDAMTANVPDSWNRTVGVAGTDIVANAVNVNRAGNSLEFVGDGATKPSLEQTLNSSAATGSLGTLMAYWRYVIGAFFRINAAATGVLAISLKDSVPAILDSGAAVASANLATMTTSFTLVTATFKTPGTIPATVKAVLEATTAINNTKHAQVDDIFCAPMHKLAAGGPFIAVIQGATKAAIGDRWTIPITNAFTAKWQRGFERAFEMRKLGLVLPTSGATLIAEGLVV